MTGVCYNILKFADPISVCRLKDGDELLFTASWDKIIRVVDLDKKLVQKAFVASKETIKEMLITNDRVIVAGCDPIIRAYAYDTGKVT